MTVSQGPKPFAPASVGPSGEVHSEDFAVKFVSYQSPTGPRAALAHGGSYFDVNAADPVVSGARVFISSGYKHGGALLDVSRGSPQLVWENKNMRNQFNSCVLWQGHLYGVDDNQLRCLAFDTGEVKWTDKISGKGSLMLADGKLIVLSEKGELFVAEASPAGFKPRSRAQVLGGKCWTTPVLANGRIYCRNAAGDVVCVDVSGK